MQYLLEIKTMTKRLEGQEASDAIREAVENGTLQISIKNIRPQYTSRRYNQYGGGAKFRNKYPEWNAEFFVNVKSEPEGEEKPRTEKVYLHHSIMVDLGPSGGLPNGDVDLTTGEPLGLGDLMPLIQARIEGTEMHYFRGLEDPYPWDKEDQWIFDEQGRNIEELRTAPARRAEAERKAREAMKEFVKSGGLARLQEGMRKREEEAS